MRLAFTVPGKPQGKGRPRFVKRGKFVTTYTPDETVSYENRIGWYAREAWQREPWPAGKPLKCAIVAVFPVPASWSKKKAAQALGGALMPTGKPDLDNVAKIVGDGLNAIVWADDSQVVEWTIAKRYGDVAGLTVTVEEAR